MTNKPEWNNQIEFYIRYPTLVSLFKIELCSESSSGETVLAREYLTINDISSFQSEFAFSPTYGPRFVDLYSEPNNKRIQKEYEGKSDIEVDKCGEEELIIESETKYKMNDYMPLSGNGAFYIAQLNMSISSKKILQNSEFKDSLIKSFSSITLNLKPVVSEFIAFGVLNDVSMIDRRYEHGEISFKLCIGLFT
jgi:hypothetical protein